MLYVFSLPHPLPLIKPPYSLRHNSIEIRPVHNSIMASKCSSEMKTCNLSLNQKLEWLSLMGGMSKAEIGQELGL